MFRFRFLLPVAAALVCGLMVGLSFPYPAIFPLAFIALVPLYYAADHSRPFPAFMAGLAAGFTAAVIIFYWIYVMVRFNTGSVIQAAACIAALSAYIGLYYGAWAAFQSVAVRTIRSIGVRVMFAAASWAALEYLRTYFLTGFPWALLGYSQAPFPAFIQSAELTGVIGISFLLVTVNGILYYGGKRSIVRAAAVALAVIFVITGAGWLRMNHVASAVAASPALRVSIVQGDIDQYKKWDRTYLREILDTYRRLTDEASRQHPDIIVWPETSIPGFYPAEPVLREWMEERVRQTGTWNLSGAPYTEDGRLYRNASLLFSPNGRLTGVHFKTHLVPFGEYVPFRRFLEPWFGILNTLGDFTRGSGTTPFKINGVPVGAAICSENFFGSVVRGFAKKGALLLVSQTNDAWFFDTAAAFQHFAMNSFRAVENRRTVVVSGNTGISGIVAPTGRVVLAARPFSRGIISGNAPLCSLPTFYTSHGDVFAALCSLLLTFALIVIYRRYHYAAGTQR